MTGAITFAGAQTWPTFNQSTTGSAATLTTGRTIALTGDVAYTSGSFDGSANVTGTATLASVGTAGTYTKVTTDAKGRVTSGTTLAATDIPGLDAAKITTGVIDAARLPSYVDDVVEAANLASFPVTGETGKIYVALDTNKVYRWSGSAYVYITSGAVDSVAGKTGVVTLTSSDVGLGNVENKSSATIRSEITSANVTTALGFTPYNATNPNGYTSNTGDVTLTGTQTLTNKTVKNSTLEAYQEKVQVVGIVSTTTYNIDLSLANVFDITLGANVTFTFTNPPASNFSKPTTIILRQGSAGNRLATFTNAKYTEGVLPQLSTGVNHIDVLTFFTINGGSFWFGTFAMANVS
jgi:phage-related tail fiber protein